MFSHFHISTFLTFPYFAHPHIGKFAHYILAVYLFPRLIFPLAQHLLVLFFNGNIYHR